MDPLILNAFIEQLSPREKHVMKIAQEHLETSFSLEKSIGFREWYEAYKKRSEVEAYKKRIRSV
jgi:hypothetical protein